MTSSQSNLLATEASLALVGLPGGTYTQGSDSHHREEAPARPVRVSGFAIAQTPVTNAQFARFVDETGYVTVAERPLDPATYPGAPVENLQAGSLVFVPTTEPVDLRDVSLWWQWIAGASWRHPEGPGSDVSNRRTHPVVHVAHEDATAFASWADLRLPTEAEWEFAARGGIENTAYTWGPDELLDGRRMAKYFEGRFPWRNTASDGYERTAPVGTYPSNGFGLYDMAGNVWEWTSDWYGERTGESIADTEGSCCVPSDPRGPGRQGSYDPHQPQFAIPRRVIKGGSFLCANEYCRRYRPAARRPQAVDTGMSHVGFRCARTIDA